MTSSHTHTLSTVLVALEALKVAYVAGSLYVTVILRRLVAPAQQPNVHAFAGIPGVSR